MTCSDPQQPRRRLAVLAIAVAALPCLGQEAPKAPATVPATTAPTAPATTQATTAPATAPATLPATAPVAPAVPPKAVVAALAAALDKGDVAAVTPLLPADDAHAGWARSTVGLIAALKQLDAAAVARFGPQAPSVSQGQLHLVESFKALEGAQERVEGDAATLTLPNRPEGLQLRRAGDRWVVVVAPADAAAAERQRAMHGRLTEAANRTAQEVAANAHATAESAAKAFAARVLQARLAL